MKKVIGVIYGGRSAEHEVSVASGSSVAKTLDRDKFEVREIFVDKAGKWFVSDKKVLVEQAVQGIDIAFPMIHGTYGEDGTLQGLLEMLDMPFVGCGVTESALGMDKEFSKHLWVGLGLPVVKFITIKKSEFEKDKAVVEKARQLQLPFFVKTANLGSSVGIEKVKRWEDLEEALKTSFQFGGKVLVEEAVTPVREIEISVLGNDKVETSVCGEIVPSREFYDYEAKYVDQTSKLIIPAQLDEEVAKEVSETAKKAYTDLGLYGFARADFLVNAETNKVFLSEVNTIPGFTQISMYPKLWEASGLSYQNLLTKLVELGFEKFKEKQSYRFEK